MALKDVVKAFLGPKGVATSRRLQKRLSWQSEELRWGGRRREAILTWLLRKHYKSLHRRLWDLGKEPPHFTYHQIGWFLMGFDTGWSSPRSFARGFYSAEILRPSDVVLDIGCGDGFLTKRFLGGECAWVDAIDLEAEAIREATLSNSASNVAYHICDATTQPFPRPQYDAIIWDGAIGHFDSRATKGMLNKIGAALKPAGIFAGSESLGRKEGHDHLQFFESEQDLAAIFQNHFEHVLVKRLNYQITNSTFMRTEAYWRCSNSKERLSQADWRDLNHLVGQKVAARP